MCTAATYKTKDFYMGRTLDYEFAYGEEVTVMPRNYPLHFRYMGDMSEHFAIIGMAHVADNYPWTSAGFWWYKNNMNTLCDKGADCITITKKVNGGTNGLADRQRYYDLCCNIFK